MDHAQAYIADLWREMNAARSKRGARLLDANDRDLFCLGMRAAGVVSTMYGTTGEDLTTIADGIERTRRCAAVQHE